MAAAGSIDLSYLLSLDQSSVGFTASLQTALDSNDYPKFIDSLAEDKTRLFVDFLDKSLGYISADTELFHKCLRALRKLCGRSRQFPSLYMVSHKEVVKKGANPAASGGFSNVWVGTLHRQKVALKCLRMSLTNEPKVMKALCKEVVVWRHLHHPNVLPLMCVTKMQSPTEWCLVSEWMESGSIVKYLTAHPMCNRLKLLSEVAKGIAYIHSRRVVHGDLKGANILIDNAGHVRLADFGLNSITTDDTSYNASTRNNDHGTARWMAPEILNLDELNVARPTQKSDIYAFSMVVIEVFTGRVPFHGISNNAVVVRVEKGYRRPRPAEIHNSELFDCVWNMVQRCWVKDPNLRPEVDEVLKFFTEAAAAFRLSSS